MRSTPVLLAGLGLLSVSLLAFLLADTSAPATQTTIEQCADWWCAKRNRLPVGVGILAGGLGIVFVGIGLTRTDAAPAPVAHDGPRLPRTPRGRTRR